jgi:sugar phosphate isomerase/epimerase
MRLSYQVATSDVKPSLDVTAYQGDLAEGFKKLHDLGYDGVELMVRDPALLNKAEIAGLAAKNNLDVVMVCTGEVFGQERLSFMDVNQETRNRALSRMRSLIEFAAFFNAQVNIGRIRGQFPATVPKETSYNWALKAFRQVAEWGERNKVTIALEPLTHIEGNFINTTQEAMELVDKVASLRFRIMLDLVPMHLEDRDILKSITDSIGYVSYVHLTDSNRRMPGSCKLDFPSIINKFAEVNYQGDYGVEILQLPDQETAMAGSILYLKPIFQQMGQER